MHIDLIRSDPILHIFVAPFPRQRLQCHSALARGYDRGQRTVCSALLSEHNESKDAAGRCAPTICCRALQPTAQPHLPLNVYLAHEIVNVPNKW